MHPFISKFDTLTFSKDHFGWSLLAFGLLLDFWTGSWPREKFITININYFILSLLVPIAFFALTAVLFPLIKNNDNNDLKVFYLSHKKIIFLLFGITMLANAVTANLMEQKLMDLENLFRVIALLLTAFAFYTKRTNIERIVLVFGFVTFIVHMIVETSKL